MTKQELKRLDNYIIWKQFVRGIFLKCFKIYGERYGHDFNDIKYDIISTARKVADFVWEQKGSNPIGEWEINYILGSIYDLDYLDRPSVIRIVNPDLGELLMKIEGPELCDKLNLLAFYLNEKQWPKRFKV